MRWVLAEWAGALLGMKLMRHGWRVTVYMRCNFWCLSMNRTQDKTCERAGTVIRHASYRMENRQSLCREEDTRYCDMDKNLEDVEVRRSTCTGFRFCGSERNRLCNCDKATMLHTWCMARQLHADACDTGKYFSFDVVAFVFLFRKHGIMYGWQNVFVVAWMGEDAASDIGGTQLEETEMDCGLCVVDSRCGRGFKKMTLLNCSWWTAPHSIAICWDSEIKLHASRTEFLFVLRQCFQIADIGRLKKGFSAQLRTNQGDVKPRGHLHMQKMRINPALPKNIQEKQWKREM